MAPSTFRTALVLGCVAGASLAACGLSLFVDDPGAGDAGVVTPTDDGAIVVLEDGAIAPLPDGAIPVLPDAGDANVRETAPPPIRDADTAIDAFPDVSCTTPVLAESFETANDAGALTLVGNARVQAGRLEVLPDEGRLNYQGAAYYNPPTPLTHYLAKLTVSTGNLQATYLRSDGFAFMVLDKAIPLNPPLRGGNELGMTNAPNGQHGYGVILDIYPPSGERRYVGSNEQGPAGNNLRDVREMVPFSTTGQATFALTVLNIGDGKTYYEVRSTFGNAMHAVPYRFGSPVDPAFQGVFLSAAAGAAFSPGFFVDDLSIMACP